MAQLTSELIDAVPKCLLAPVGTRATLVRRADPLDRSERRLELVGTDAP